MTERQSRLRNLTRRLRETNFEESIMVKVMLFFGLVLIITLLAPSQNKLNIHYEVGTIWTHEDVIAPFSFPIYKAETVYDKEVKEAVANVKPVYDRIEIAKSRLDSTASFIGEVRNVLEMKIRTDRIRNKKVFAKDSAAAQQALQNLPYTFSSSEWSQLLMSVYKTPSILRKLGSLMPVVTSIIVSDYQTGIIDRPRDQVGASVIVARHRNSERPVPVDQVLTLQDVSNELEQATATMLAGDTTTAGIISSAVAAQILPNLIYNRTQTQREISAAIDLVPRTVGFVKENERIIGKHDRITKEIKLKLDSLERALRERTGQTDLILQFLGKFLMVFVIIGLLSIYLYLFRRKLFYNNKMLSLIAVLFVFEALLMFFAFTTQTKLPLQYLVLVPVASMILAIVFDSRVAFQATVAIALLVGAMKGNDFSAAFVSLSAGALAVYTVRDIKNRTQIFRSLVFIFIGYGIATFAISLQKGEDASAILTEFSFIAVNAILSPIITFGLLIFFEKVFGIATDLTLLELSDFNQPLLRELSQKAPGTFHHSIIVGTLAEKAAEAVNANPILARVGAYYHDIGKTLKPEYFIENTMDPHKSKHDWLPPDISVQMVVSHVTDGVELARKHHLPQRIADFIPMHHGTTLVAYFYGKALRRPFATGDVSEDDYRYDGPKPRSKETAIVMLADSVEAATRSLQDKSLENVNAMIDAIVKSRYEEGQLDETNLTFNDLTKIKESFLAVLSGIYHKRIEYPGQAAGKLAAKPQLVEEAVVEEEKAAAKLPEVEPTAQKEPRERSRDAAQKNSAGTRPRSPKAAGKRKSPGPTKRTGRPRRKK